MALEQENRGKLRITIVNLSVWTGNKADAITATPAGSFMTTETEMRRILSLAEGRAGLATPPYAVIGKMGDVAEEVDADTFTTPK